MNGLSPKGGNTVSGLLDSVSEYAGHRLSRHLSSGSNNGLYWEAWEVHSTHEYVY